MKLKLAFAVAVLGVMLAATAARAADSLVEIYRIAPGQHAAFLKFIALCDQANKEAGLPPRQLYVHQDGASWDYMLIQPAHTTDEQDKQLDAAYKKLGIPQGANFHLEIRRFITEHTDTFVEGPTTAADWLQKVK
jgi:hypothetical protein